MNGQMNTIDCYYYHFATNTDTSVDVASIEDVQDTYTAAVSGMRAVNIGTGKQSVNVCSREDRKKLSKEPIVILIIELILM